MKKFLVIAAVSAFVSTLLFGAPAQSTAKKAANQSVNYTNLAAKTNSSVNLAAKANLNTNLSVNSAAKSNLSTNSANLVKKATAPKATANSATNSSVNSASKANSATKTATNSRKGTKRKATSIATSQRVVKNAEATRGKVTTYGLMPSELDRLNRDVYHADADAIQGARDTESAL